jgi:hypothetical protein
MKKNGKNRIVENFDRELLIKDVKTEREGRTKLKKKFIDILQLFK